MFKKSLIIFFFSAISFVLCSSNPRPNANPVRPGASPPQYDIFDYWFGWIFDYSDEDYDFNNKNVTSK